MRETKKETRLRKAIRDEMGVADGAYNDELQRKREMALAYYRGDARGDEVDDRSAVVSLDLNAAVTSNLALMRSMLIQDASVETKAEGPQDRALADAETQVVRRIIYDVNHGERHLMHAIKDGLLSGNACMTCEWIDDRLEVRAVPSENVLFRQSWDGPLQTIPYFAEKAFYSRSDLIEMGVPKSKVEHLSTKSDQNARDGARTRMTKGAEKETDTIQCHWNYIRIDLDGDDIAELHRVLTGPDERVLMFDETEVIPYILGVPFVNPHRLVGESLFDKLKQVQDVMTSFLRGMVDNTNLINNGRYIYDPKRVTEDDIFAAKAGGGIRARDPSAIVPLAIPDATSGLITGMEFMRRKRSEVSGAAIDMASADAQIMQKSATQASIDKSNSELVASLIARTLALTLIEPLFKLVHLMLREYGTQTYQVEISGTLQPIQPQQFNSEREFVCHVGKTPSEKSQEAMALMQHLQAQTMAMQAGMNGVLASPQTLYLTQKRSLELAGVEDVDKYLIDPSSPQAQEAAQAAQQAQQQQAAQQAQMVQLQMQLEKAKLDEDARQHDGDLAHKYFDTEMDAAMREATLAGQGAIDLEKARISANDRRAEDDNTGATERASG